MTVKIDLLRQAIAYLREHPSEYNQDHYWGSYSGTTCVIGRAAILSGRSFVDSYTLDNGQDIYFDWTKNFLGLSGEDKSYIANYSRTLDEIEARVNEIDARENPPVEVEIVNVKVNGITYNVPANHLDWFIVGARVVDPNVRIVKISETEL